MRILTGAAAVAAVLLIGVAGSASAAEATGVIKSLDTAKDMVTLDNGSSYDVAKSVTLASFKVGEKVTITYTQSGKMMDATAIKPAA
jgi:Cu/Ag efflux protein CusF